MEEHQLKFFSVSKQNRLMKQSLSFKNSICQSWLSIKISPDNSEAILPAFVILSFVIICELWISAILPPCHFWSENVIWSPADKLISGFSCYHILTVLPCSLRKKTQSFFQRWFPCSSPSLFNKQIVHSHRKKKNKQTPKCYLYNHNSGLKKRTRISKLQGVYWNLFLCAEFSDIVVIRDKKYLQVDRLFVCLLIKKKKKKKKSKEKRTLILKTKPKKISRQ